MGTKKQEVDFVFSGTQKATVPSKKKKNCSSECVGGSASKGNMSATN